MANGNPSGEINGDPGTAVSKLFWSQDIGRHIFLTTLAAIFFFATPTVRNNNFPEYMRLDAVPISIGITLTFIGLSLRYFEWYMSVALLFEVIGTCCNLFPFASILAYLLSGNSYWYILPIVCYFVLVGLLLLLSYNHIKKTTLIIENATIEIFPLQETALVIENDTSGNFPLQDPSDPCPQVSINMDDVSSSHNPCDEQPILQLSRNPSQATMVHHHQ